MKKKLNIAILTVSDTRNSKTDKSGELLKNKILNSHHNLFEKKICKDNKLKKYIKRLDLNGIINPLLNKNQSIGIAKKNTQQLLMHLKKSFLKNENLKT